MLFQIISYLKFLWYSKNEHAVHSPFVFDLITKCFYDKKFKPEYIVLKNYRKLMLENKNVIDVTDFGTGSKVFKSNTRTIAAIAKTACISDKRAKLLFRITTYFKPDNILELGTSLGIATAALAEGTKDRSGTSIITLEGCPATAKIAQSQLKKFNFVHVKNIICEFSQYLTSLPSNYDSFKLIYFDGNHSKTATLEYFELLLPTAHNDSIWIFDDIHWSKEMEITWQIIKQHPAVSVTIDTYHWGLVFFRKEQLKEHFTIRI